MPDDQARAQEIRRLVTTLKDSYDRNAPYLKDALQAAGRDWSWLGAWERKLAKLDELTKPQP